MSTAATTAGPAQPASDPDFRPGLEGVVAFESEIAEPDKEGGALRYRGVDINDLVGRVSFGQVWGLLVDNEFDPGLPPAEPFPLPVHTGDIRVDVQSALAQLAPVWGFTPAARHRRRGGPREPRPRLGHGDLVHRPVGPRADDADGAPARGRQGPHHRRAVHDPLARRPRPQARRGHRLLLHLRGRARHERVDLHRAGHRLDRCRRRGLPLRGDRRPVGAAARRGPQPRPAHDRGRRADGRRPPLRRARRSTARSG